MTEPTDFEARESVLPGLEPPRPSESSMRRSTRRTIVALEAAGYLDESHAMLTDLLLHLADVIDAGVRQGRASAAAMAAAQIIATYQVIVPEANGGGDSDDWNELVADIRRSAAQPRDTT